MNSRTEPAGADRHHSVVIVGGGAAGISVASSLHKRDRRLDIAILEPSATHHYQPGWTMVGGGVFQPEVTSRPMSQVMPGFVSGPLDHFVLARYAQRA